MEQNTTYFKDAATITVDSAIVLQQDKKNGSKEDCQANRNGKNDANRSIEKRERKIRTKREQSNRTKREKKN